MSTPNLNVLLSAAINAYDNLITNTPLLVKLDAQTPNFPGSSQLYEQYLQVPTTGTTLPLPANPTYIVWVRNRSTNINLTITPTFAGVVTPSPLIIGPGDVFINFCGSKTGGITNLQLFGDGATCACEVYLAG